MHGQELVVDKAAPKQKEPFPLVGGGLAGPGAGFRAGLPPSLSAERMGSAQYGGGGAFGNLVGAGAAGAYGPLGSHGLQQQSQQNLLSGSLPGVLSGSAGSLGAYDSFPGLEDAAAAADMSLSGESGIQLPRVTRSMRVPGSL